MSMGEAAGLAAAMGLAAGVQPREFDPLPLVARLADLRGATEPAFAWMRNRQAAPV